MHSVSAAIELPPWLAGLSGGELLQPGTSDEARMELAIRLARQNVVEGTGGPFAAVVIEENSGTCVAAGVNLVVAAGLSIAHAEAVSIMLAQRQAGTFDLAGDPARTYSLYASGQPCVMCFGILWWSGVSKLVCGARAVDIEQLTGFREGPLPNDWPALLSGRTELPALEVVQDVLRQQACEVLRAYSEAGHPVYNPGSTGD